MVMFPAAKSLLSKAKAHTQQQGDVSAPSSHVSEVSGKNACTRTSSAAQHATLHAEEEEMNGCV